jgi:Fe-S oxidoreductase
VSDQSPPTVRDSAVGRAHGTVRTALDGRTICNLEACLRCDLCAEACDVFLGDGERASTPAHKVELAASVYRRAHTPLGRLWARLVGAREIDTRFLGELVDAAFGRCTLCGRCSINCVAGLDPAEVVRFARRLLAAADMIPADILHLAANSCATGNSIALPVADVKDAVAALEQRLRAETGDSALRFPLDRRGARVLYAYTATELREAPATLLAAARILSAAGEDWTLSSIDFDVTNFGYFTGDPSYGRTIAERQIRRAEELGVKLLVTAECGHGYRALRWEAPEWLGREPRVQVLSVVELIASYLSAGRIRLDPARNSARVTLHDPCELVRNGGVIEEPRAILYDAVGELVEMTPNRVDNHCCGGGGGMLVTPELRARRLAAGAVKAEQIRATGASVVVAPCQSCVCQLKDLSVHYQLGIEVLTLTEVVAAALVSTT